MRREGPLPRARSVVWQGAHLVVGDDLNLIVLEDGNARVRCSERAHTEGWGWGVSWLEVVVGMVVNLNAYTAEDSYPVVGHTQRRLSDTHTPVRWEPGVRAYVHVCAWGAGPPRARDGGSAWQARGEAEGERKL